MNYLEQIHFIKKSTGLLDRISQEDVVFYNQLKDITDNFTDLSEDIFNEGAKLGIAKIYNKLKTSEKMDDLKEATKDNPNIVFATIPKEEKTSKSKKEEVLDEIFANDPDGMLDIKEEPKPKAESSEKKEEPKSKFKAGQYIKFKHEPDSPNKNKSKTLNDFGIIENVRGTDIEKGETSYFISWATGVKGGVVYEDHLTKISEKEYNEGIEKVKYAEANPKKVEPEYAGGFVALESVEHKIISRFLGLRAKDAPESLVLNAYTDLQKKIANQEVRKTNKFADLIQAIQGSYYNMLTKSDVKTLVLSEKFTAVAVYLFDNERRYSSVKLMSEFAGWTGKSKTLKQIKLFLAKAENVIKEGKGTDPYHHELENVVKSLKSAQEGHSIVPELIGLSGLGSIFAIHVVK